MSCTRTQILSQARAWLGSKESDGSHKKIIDTYNAHIPRARGYILKYDDAWCSGFVSACAIACGATDIIPTEVGVGKHIELFKKLGIWVEADDYVPTPGDIIVYYWKDNGNGDCKSGASHIGFVEAVADGMQTVIEGNYSNSVKRRSIAVNGRYIRGFACPNYLPETSINAPTAGGTGGNVMKKVYLSPSNQTRNLYAHGDTNEAVQCEKMAEYCKAALERSGVSVQVGSRNMNMEKRCIASDAMGADLHVPIHTNAFNGKVSGTRIMCYSLSGEGYRASKVIFDALAPLTPGISENITANQSLYEVRKPKAATVYIEVDFHDVSTAAKWLIENTEAIGEAIAQGVCQHLGVVYVTSGGKQPEPEKAELPVTGIWDTATTARLQQIFGTAVDGEISNQHKVYQRNNPGLTTGWGWEQKPNGKGSQLIKAMQKWAGMAEGDCDGEIGPATIRALQKKLGTVADGYVSATSAMVKALQAWCNEQ